jgi:hypothetical protein
MKLTALKKSERELELVETQNAEFQDKKVEKQRVAASKTIIIADEQERIQRERNTCKHKSGGKGLPGFFNGDGKWGYSVATQELPTGEVYYICFRCQEEWHLPKKRDVITAFTKHGLKEGMKALTEYRKRAAKYYEVAAWDKPLFNTDSGVIPGSVKFHIPRLIDQSIKDDQEFAETLKKHEVPFDESTSAIQ